MCDIEETELDLKFEDLCRLCASYGNQKINVFSDEGKRRQLRKKIQYCLPFKIEENDGLPKSLCFKCVDSLESTYDFRYKCIQVNRNLEKHLQKRENQEKSSTSHSQRIHPEVSIFAIPTSPTNSESNVDEFPPMDDDSEDGPNPFDYLKVDVNAEDNDPDIRLKSNINENKKQQYVWNANKRWLSVEPKPLEHQANTMKMEAGPDENSLSRRKNNNPRKIAREIEEGGSNVTSEPVSAVNGGAAPGLIAISADVRCLNSSRPPRIYGYASSQQSQLARVLTSSSKANQNDDNDGEPRPYSCLLCEQNFGQRSSLDKHLSAVHGIEPQEVLSQAPLLMPPPSLVSSFGKAYGEEATTTAAAAAAATTTIITTNDEELAESMMEQETVIFCEVCRREFHDRASLWLHMVHAHREEASVSCGICLKICADNITLIEHVNTAHSGDKAVVQRRYSCQVCGRQHDSRQKLLKHATLHTLIDNQGQTIQPEEMVSLNNAFAPRECPVCRKKFFSEEKLAQHTHNFHSDGGGGGVHDHNSASVAGGGGANATSSSSVAYKCELCASAHATRMDRWWHMYHAHDGDPRVTCERAACRKIFVTQALRDEHCRAHHQTQGDFTNTCEICGKLWESRPVFYKHMMNVHPKCLPTICGVCLKIFSNVPELRQHVHTEHPPTADSAAISCDVCGRPYAERSKMLRHRRVHNVTDGVANASNASGGGGAAAIIAAKKKDELQCTICPQLCFDKLEEIAEHRRTVHQLFVCDLCPKFYNGNNHLWKHVSKQHKGDPSVTCNLCLRTSASRAHLERHKIKYHSDPVDKLVVGGKPVEGSGSAAGHLVHKCHLCAKIFRIRSLLKKHLKTCKGAKPRPPKMQPVNGVFPCGKCHKVFELQSVLTKHMKNSHVMHYCEACAPQTKLGFDSKTALFEHIRAQHADDPELVCDVPRCGKVLRLKADLQKHKQEHLRGYFTYICEMCGDTFSNRKKLRKHLLTFHKASVPHLCAVCVAILPTVDELVEHLRANHPLLLHRPYTCHICGKCYPVGCKVVEHIAKSHGKEFKPCKLCWKVFKDERQLEQHVQNHPPAEDKPTSAAAVKRADSRVRAKSNLSQELAALGINYEAESSGGGGSPGAGTKRAAEEEANYEEGGKRLRKKYKCASCKETFRSIDELKQHKLEQHANEAAAVARTTAANECRASEATPTTTNSSLVEPDPRTERWTDYRPIKCDSCGRTWNSKKQLWQHLIRSHPFESMHTCGVCLKVCKNYYELFYHLDEQHSSILNDSLNRFACYVCGHLHNSQSKLEKHVGVHKNPPQPCKYTCHYCRIMFRSVVFYREHLRHHELTASSVLQQQQQQQKNDLTSEFSGFSINNILETRLNDGNSDLPLDEEELVEIDEEDSDSENESDGGGEQGAPFKGYESNAYSKLQLPNLDESQTTLYDTKLEDDIEEDDDEDEDEEDEDDEDEERGGAEIVKDETMDFESAPSCCSSAEEGEGESMPLFNGKGDRGDGSDEGHSPSTFGTVVNNGNQNRERKRSSHFDEKRPFSASNGEKFFVE